MRGGKTSPAIVEHPNHIACLDVALFGIPWMDSDLLAAMHFVAARNGCRIHLAMQPVPRLVRDQMQRPARRRSAAEPLRRCQPCRVRRAVCIAETGYRLGGDLDPARRGP